MRTKVTTWKDKLGLSIVFSGSCTIAALCYFVSRPIPQTPSASRPQGILDSLALASVASPAQTYSREPAVVTEQVVSSMHGDSTLPMKTSFQTNKIAGEPARKRITITQETTGRPDQLNETRKYKSSHDLEFEDEIREVLALASRKDHSTPAMETSLMCRPSHKWNREEAKSTVAQVVKAAKSAAWARAQAENWPTVDMHEDGEGGAELMAIHENLVYMYETDNDDAAIAAHAETAIIAASLTSANGSSVTVGIWDQGSALPTHQELTGRVTVKDDADAVSHATHAGGTIIASGVIPAAKGMAPSARLDSYNWSYDLAEMTEAAMSEPREASKIQISSHSYGYITGWANTYSPARWYGNWGEKESAYFGMYDWYAKEWDKICYGAKYYLPFKSAGNNRSDRAPNPGTNFKYYDGGWQTKSYDPNTDPAGDGASNGGYDTIPMIGNAKNVITVGAVHDAVKNKVRDLTKATMTSFSGWGPADDGRVKPDVVANGTLLYSSKATSTDDYGNMSGTSMSTPSAAGVGALLLDAYNKFFPGESMLASSLKGLILHTADDLGNVGPDYIFGWGHVNAKAAMDLVIAHDNDMDSGRLLVNKIYSEETHTFRYEGDGTEPAKITICWTDPDGDYSYGPDDRSARLVNDLNLRVIGPDGTTTLPFVLDPENPSATATRGNNDRDNVEQVLINSTSPGVYEIRVQAPASLTDDVQEYSMLVSGLSAISDEPPSVNLSTASQSELGARSYVRVDGVVADRDSESVALEVNYSVDNGSTWSPTTLVQAENETGNLAIDNSQQAQVPDLPLLNSSSFTIHWDTLDTVIYSQTTVVRIRAWDGNAWSDWSESSPFIVNNQGPDSSQMNAKVSSGWAFERYILDTHVDISFTNHSDDISNIVYYRYGVSDDPNNSTLTTNFTFSVNGLVEGELNTIYIWAEDTSGRLSEPVILDVYVLAYPGAWDGRSALDVSTLSNAAAGDSDETPFMLQASAVAGIPILRFPHRPNKQHTIEYINQLAGESSWSTVTDTSYTVDNGWIIWVNDPKDQPDAPLLQFYRARTE